MFTSFSLLELSWSVGRNNRLIGRKLVEQNAFRNFSIVYAKNSKGLNFSQFLR